MAYDETLAARIGAALQGRSGISEKKMFGGIAFLLEGRMFAGVAGDSLMARIGSSDHERALRRPHVREMDFTGRPMRGYVFVGPEALKSRQALSEWLERCLSFVATVAPGAPAPRSVGYSGTGLAKKLGISKVARVAPIAAPDGYERWLEPLPAQVVLDARVGPATDLAHVFVTEKEELARLLTRLRKKLRADATLWVSWPKKSSKVPTTVDEDTIRRVALPLGFVDVKVCAVTEVWSGLKLVVRKELR